MLEQNQALSAYWAAQWANRTPVAYGNQVYKPTPGTPWVRFSIVPASASAAAISPPALIRQVGLIHITVFVPIGEGENRALFIADAAASVINCKVIAGVTTGAAGIVASSIAADDGGWWCVSVQAPFSYDR